MKKKVIIISVLSIFALAGCKSPNNPSSEVSDSSSSVLSTSTTSDDVSLTTSESTSSLISSSTSTSESSSIESSSEATSLTSTSDDGITHLTNLRFIKKTIDLHVDEEAQLTWKYYPSDASIKDVSFEVSDETICIVNSEGLVKGLKLGTTTVTITSKDGNFKDTATINVNGEDAESIKIVVPEDTLKSGDTYFIQVGTSIQLSTILNPSDAVNRFTYAAFDRSNQSVEDYVSIDENGLMTALKPMMNITVSAVTDNNKISSVKFSALTKSKYSSEYIRQKISSSLALESENVVNATLEERSKKVSDYTYIDEFKIYENGITKTRTTRDNLDDTFSVKNGYIGIKNDKFYTLIRDDNNYDVMATECLPIGSEKNQITREEAELRSSVISTTTLFGSSNILLDKVIDSITYFSTTQEWIEFNFEATDNRIRMSGSFEKLSNYYLVKSLFYKLDLTINLDDLGMITSYQFISNAYDSTGYNFDNHQLSSSAKPAEIYSLKLNQESGARTTCNDFAISPEQCYFTSFDVNTYAYTEDEISSTFEIGDIVHFKVINPNPSTATTLIDDVYFTSSSDPNVVDYSSQGGLKALGSGTCVLTFTSSNGVICQKEVTVKYKAAEKIQFVNLDVNGIKVGESIEEFNARVLPEGSKQDYKIEIISGQDCGRLDYNSETKLYSLTALKEGKITVKTSSIDDPNISITKDIYVYQEISEDQVPTLLTTNDFVCYVEAKDRYYYLQFMNDGTGYVYTLDGEIVSWLGYFNYSISGYEITISDTTSIVGDVFYSVDGKFIVSQNGIEITGTIYYGSGSNEKTDAVFAKTTRHE